MKEDYKSIEKITELYNKKKIDEKIFNRAKDVLEGNVKYTYQREFSTTFEDNHKIVQAGDLDYYSDYTLKFNVPTSEFNLTGIYGLTGQKIRVFVDAEQNSKLPKVVFTQNHGYYTAWKREKTLQLGMNEFEYDNIVDYSSHIDSNERKGGAIYISNPYTADEQGDVSIYIEGGGYYPIYRKGDDEKSFLSALTEYYKQYRNSQTMLDMAELSTDHALITTTAQSLYNVYVEDKEISPSENLRLWGNYMNEVFRFNGIADTEQNKNIVVNFRYMSSYAKSGAYTYDYHIGFYGEHYWFANFNSAKTLKHNLSEHLIFGVGHELGHMIDIDNRRINETTNNFTGAFAYFKIVGMPQQNQLPLQYEQYAPFDKTLNNIASDYTLNYQAYHDGKIMYTNDYTSGSGSIIRADHNYLIWWDLECVFPGYWGRLNNFYQSDSLVALSNLERMVYYSSLAAEVDLSYYFERWGFYWSDEYTTNLNDRFTYEKSTQNFKDLMSQAKRDGKISETNAPYWYADTLQYDFIQQNQDLPESERKYGYIQPKITKITQSGSERIIFISSEKNPNHLGYQVLSKTENCEWKVAGFTYTSNFVDKTSYLTPPTYKVVAYNRFFNASRESEEQSNITQDGDIVCKLESRPYSDLNDAIHDATTGQTIYLLEDCSIEGTIPLYKNINIAVDPSVSSDIVLTADKAMIQMVYDFSISGNENASIIIDGRSIENGNPVIYVSGGTFVAKYVTFQNLRAKNLAGAIFGLHDVELYHCLFDNCKNSKSFAVVEAQKSLKMEDCVFNNQQDVSVKIKDVSNLTLINKINSFSLNFDDFSEEKNINLIGSFSQDDTDKISVKSGYLKTFENNKLKIKPENYHLKFNIDGQIYETDVTKPQFEFGDEGYNYNLTSNQYVKYIEKGSEKVYYSGDKINLASDMEFDVEVKSKIKLTIYYNGSPITQYYPEDVEIYLPIIDPAKQSVLAYLDGCKTYYAGQNYVLKKESSLVAIYEGKFMYRYIVSDTLYGVNYGKYNDQIELIELADDDFQGWQCGDETISDNFVLRGDTDLIAVFWDSSQIYDLSQCEIYINGNYTYSGEQITPKITVYFNGMIVPRKCYSILCSNNISASKQAQVTISFVQGLSTGSKTENFTILPKHLNKTDVEVEGLKDFVYNGSQTTQNLTITYQNQAIDTFTVNYNGDRTNAGDVQIEITFFGNYSGTINWAYKISKADRVNFKVVQVNWIYGGNAPSPTVEGEMENAQITYSYSSSRDGSYLPQRPTNAGTYWIKAVVEQSQNYNAAEATAQFTIEKAENPPQMPNTEMTISRKAKTLQDVKLNTEGWNWETPSTKIDKDTIKAYAIYKDTQNYVNFQVKIAISKLPPKDIKKLDVKLEAQDFVYNGEERTPKVITKDGDFILVKGTDYEVEYKNNTYAGQASVIVNGINDYTGSLTLNFTISKAEKPSVNNTTIKLDHKVTKLSDVQLPSDFVWENEDMEITGNRVTAKAIYKGKDANSYETTELTFEIIIEEQEQNPLEKPESSSLIWLAIGISVAVLMIAVAGFIIIRVKSNNRWRNK